MNSVGLMPVYFIYGLFGKWGLLLTFVQTTTLKTIKLFLFWVCILSALVAFSQPDSAGTSAGMTYKFDVLSPVVGASQGGIAFNISIEKELEPHASVQLSYYHRLFFPNPNQYVFTTDYENRIIPEFEYYLNCRHWGPYVGIFVDFIHDHEIDGVSYGNAVQQVENDYTVTIVTTGILAGFKVFAGRKINVDFMIGVGVGKIIHTQVNTGDATEFRWANRLLVIDGIYSISFGYRL